MYEQFQTKEAAVEAGREYALSQQTTITVAHDTEGKVYKILPYGSVYMRGEYPIESFDRRGKHPYAA
jgi:hypothetical protein